MAHNAPPPWPIGVVGVGNMGAGMTQRLRACGHAVVVHDVRREAEAAAAAVGATVLRDAAAVASRCALLIVAVVDAAQCDAVLFAPRGVVAGAHAETAVMVCSTIGPDDVLSLADRLGKRGVPLIDAPMSGGPARARDGTMSLMVACADALFARYQSVLRELSSRLVRVGERVGDGARTKLVNNLLAAINLVGAAEATALAERLGLDARRTLEVFEQSSAQSWIGSDRLPRALKGDFEPRAHTRLLAKDTTLAIAMASQAGLAPPLGALAQEIFARACHDGLADLDDASLLTLMRQLVAEHAG